MFNLITGLAAFQLPCRHFKTECISSSSSKRFPSGASSNSRIYLRLFFSADCVVNVVFQKLSRFTIACNLMAVSRLWHLRCNYRDTHLIMIIIKLNIDISIACSRLSVTFYIYIIIY